MTKKELKLIEQRIIQIEASIKLCHPTFNLDMIESLCQELDAINERLVETIKGPKPTNNNEV